MCGVVGWIGKNSSGAVDAKRIREMAAAVSHRGPDDEGYLILPNAALGHRRLSIIDLEGGKQPMSTPDGRYTIVFNGEIFNYRELATTLASQGVIFRTSSDTEVILAGFSTHGPEFLSKLHGMFALLIFDHRDEVMHAARDPFGIKPLYVREDARGHFFASEIRALCTELSDGGDREISSDAMQSYIRLGYVFGRESFVKGIRRLSPGIVLSVGADGTTREEVFDDRLLPAKLRKNGTDKPKIRDVLIRAVDRALVSDVPVGLYLSGGIDSSLIAAIVRRELDKSLVSFSVGFPGSKSHDESAHALRVADALKLEHVRTEIGPEDFLDLSKLARVLEEPLADPSAMALLKLSACARARVKVVLSGEGGDELFGGYHRYFWHVARGQYLTVPKWIRRLFEMPMYMIPGSKWTRRLRKLGETENASEALQYFNLFSPFTMKERDTLFRMPPAWRALDEKFEAVFSVARSMAGGSRVQWVDLVTFLRDDLLPKADRASMWNSLEVRVPYLQADVAQAAFSLPDNDRISFRETKPLLRDLLRTYLPPEIVDRPKQGFEVPLSDWFRGPLRIILNEYVSEERIRARGLWDWSVVRAIRDENDRGGDRGLALYALALVEAWMCNPPASTSDRIDSK